MKAGPYDQISALIKKTPQSSLTHFCVKTQQKRLPSMNQKKTDPSRQLICPDLALSSLRESLEINFPCLLQPLSIRSSLL